MTTPDRAQRRYNRLLALGGETMPETFSLSGVEWMRRRVFKHDFVAATGLYEDSEGNLVVLKLYRLRHYYGIPFEFISRWEARHEERVYRALQDTGHVPRWIGRYGKAGIVHEFVPGEDLTRDTNLPPRFFQQLEALLEALHERGIAYLDTNKMDNILVGADGKCYLIDFQISWIQPRLPLSLLTWPLFQVFKRSDGYHLYKQRRRLRPDEVSRRDLARARPWFIRFHRRIATPYRRVRRRYLRKVESAATERPEGHERH